MTDAIKVTFPSGIEATINPGEPCYPLAQENERLRGQVARYRNALAAMNDRLNVGRDWHLQPDHPHTDPGDKRTECPTCHKWIYEVTHSCKGVDVRTYCPGCEVERLRPFEEKVARVEALAAEWELLATGPFSPDAPATLMNAVKAKQLRAALAEPEGRVMMPGLIRAICDLVLLAIFQPDDEAAES